MTPDPAADPSPRRAATVLESVEEIRALARRSATIKEPIPRASPGAATGPPPVRPATAIVGDETRPFRPIRRPSMALLLVLDDGLDEGEEIRVRAESFTIGRVEGDLVIPHDPGISGRHAEIVRRLDGGQLRWFLRDLQSTNGTFARASSVVLRDGQEVLLGSMRLRLEIPSTSAPAAPPIPATTQKWQALSPASAKVDDHPCLVEQKAEGEGRRFLLADAETTVGRDPQMARLVLDDPMISPVHARIARDAKGRWVIHNADSLNGLWARVEEVPLDRGGQFQCGEQRFLIKIL